MNEFAWAMSMCMVFIVCVTVGVSVSYIAAGDKGDIMAACIGDGTMQMEYINGDCKKIKE